LLSGVGFFLLEIVGRIVDRPTWAVVVAYAVLALGAGAVEFVGADRMRAPRGIASVLALLALLGQVYLLAFACRLHPGIAVGLVALAGLTWGIGIRRSSAPPVDVVPPVLTLFVVLHLLVEGSAGHILTPWLHAVSAWMARWSASSPILYGSAAALLVVAPLGFSGRARRSLAAVGILAAVTALATALAPAVGPWLGAVGVAGFLGWSLALRGAPLVGWLDPRPLVLLARVAPVSLLALSLVAAHYTSTMWRCDPVWPDDVRLLSSASGTFDLTTDDQTLIVSLREARTLLVLAPDAPERRTTTEDALDTLFDRTEPETLLTSGPGDVLVLLSSSDGEQGNRLARFDPTTGGLTPGPAGIGESVSDLVAGVWMSTETEGRVLHLDPETLSVVAERALQPIDGTPDDVEANRIIVDPDRDRLWSIGLWEDRLLRLTELSTGGELRSLDLGTHQWDMAYDRAADRLYIPRLVEGAVRVVDASSLEEIASWPAGFGVRPIAVTSDGALVVTGNLYTGEIVGWDAGSGERRFRRRVGGHLKGLHVSSSGRIFTGTDCGVFEVIP
jgi:hypothetical protein